MQGLSLVRCCNNTGCIEVRWNAIAADVTTKECISYLGSIEGVSVLAHCYICLVSSSKKTHYRTTSLSFFFLTKSARLSFFLFVCFLYQPIIPYRHNPSGSNGILACPPLRTCQMWVLKSVSYSFKRWITTGPLWKVTPKWRLLFFRGKQGSAWFIVKGSGYIIVPVGTSDLCYWNPSGHKQKNTKQKTVDLQNKWFLKTEHIWVLTDWINLGELCHI